MQRPRVATCAAALALAASTFALAGPAAAAETGTISGTVTFASDGAPVNDVQHG